MRYRKLSATGDYTFGQSLDNYYIDEIDISRQSVQTRLQLNQGDWFLDTTAGVPWDTKVLGPAALAPSQTRDLILKSIIIGSKGVTSIATYTATKVVRDLTVTGTVYTIYSAEPVEIEASV